MTLRVDSIEPAIVHPVAKTQVSGGLRFDWAMIAVCTWLISGIFADGWAHNHLPIDNFFTPWHAILYSGLLVVAIFLVGNFIRNRVRGYSWLHAIPAGYELSLLGSLLFFVSGIGDLIWHTLFGIEKGVDAALSPTHLAIVFCSVLIMSGPYRAAWLRSQAGSTSSLVRLLPMIFSLTYTLSVVTVIAQLLHPFVFTWPSDTAQVFDDQALAIASIVLQTVILMGLVLLTVRRWKLPLGALTIVFTLNITLLSFMQDHYILIIPAALAGFVADLLIWKLQPSIKQPTALRIFAFAVPTILYLLYFLTLSLTTGVNWTIHLWLGSTVVAGVAGWFLSYLLVPPRLPGEHE